MHRFWMVDRIISDSYSVHWVTFVAEEISLYMEVLYAVEFHYNFAFERRLTSGFQVHWTQRRSYFAFLFFDLHIIQA